MVLLGQSAPGLMSGSGIWTTCNDNAALLYSESRTQKIQKVLLLTGPTHYENSIDCRQEIVQEMKVVLRTFKNTFSSHRYCQGRDP